MAFHWHRSSNYMTMSGLEWPFALNSLSRMYVATFRDNCMKINRYIRINCQPQKYSSGTLVSGNSLSARRFVPARNPPLRSSISDSCSPLRSVRLTFRPAALRFPLRSHALNSAETLNLFQSHLYFFLLTLSTMIAWFASAVFFFCERGQRCCTQRYSETWQPYFSRCTRRPVATTTCSRASKSSWNCMKYRSHLAKESWTTSSLTGPRPKASTRKRYIPAVLF